MVRNLHRLLRWLLGLLLFPFLLYLCFPLLASIGLEYYLRTQGFQHVNIELGYPTFERVPTPVVSMETDLFGQMVTLRMDRSEVTYDFALLLSGMVDRIHFRTISLDMRPLKPDEKLALNNTVPQSRQRPPQTIAELLNPLPILPFRELLVDKMSIHRVQHRGPFQQVSLSGIAKHETGKLSGLFMFEGPDISSYTFSFSGQFPSDIHAVLQSSASSQPMINLTSTLTRFETDMRLHGSAKMDVQKLLPFLKLFLPLNKEWETASGTLTADWNGSLPQSIDLQTALKEKTGSATGTVHVDVVLPQYAPFAKDIAMNLYGNFSAGYGHVDWSLTNQSEISAQLDLTTLPLPKVMNALIPLHAHRVAVDVPDSIHGQIALTGSMPSFTVDGNLHATYTISSLPIHAELSLSRLSAKSLENMIAEGSFHLSGQLEDLSKANLPIKDLSWDLTGNAFFNNKTLSLTLLPSSSLITTPFPMDNITIPTTTVAFRNQATGTYRLGDDTWQVGPTQLKVQIPRLTWKEFSTSFQGMNLNIKSLKGNPKTWTTSGDVVLMGVDVHGGPLTPPVTNWKFGFSVDPSFVLVDLFGETSTKTASLIGRLQHRLSTQRGGLLVKVRPMTLSPSAFNLRTEITPWPYPLDITGGHVSGSVKLLWTIDPHKHDEALTFHHAETVLALNHLSGHYENVIFKDLTTEVKVLGAQNWSMPEPTLVTIDELTSGITASKIRFHAQANPLPSTVIPLIEIRDFSLKLLGGEISSEFMSYNDIKPHNAFAVRLEGLDLEALLQLEQQEDLHGTGLLDGELPITINEHTLTIHQGHLQARPPGGVIRYHIAEETAQSLTQTHPQMNLVLQALENFHYDVLKAGIDYTADGTLRLQTTLQGKNPDLYKGRPIHVNLNVEENIPALLQSLQVASGVEAQIERMLQGQ